jgi:preprotein translocase subunit SecY
LFAQQNYGDNLKKQGAQIPGVARGGPTQRYLTKVQRRITLPGALFLGVVAALPFFLGLFLPPGLQTTTGVPGFIRRSADCGGCGSRYLPDHRIRPEITRL